MISREEAKQLLSLGGDSIANEINLSVIDEIYDSIESDVVARFEGKAKHLGGDSGYRIRDNNNNGKLPSPWFIDYLDNPEHQDIAEGKTYRVTIEEVKE